MRRVLEPKPSIAEHQAMNRTLLAVLVLGLGGCSLVLDDPLAFQGQTEVDMADVGFLPDRRITDRYVPLIEVDARIRSDQTLPDATAELDMLIEVIDADVDRLDSAQPEMSVMQDMSPDMQDLSPNIQDMSPDQGQSANDGGAMADGG